MRLYLLRHERRAGHDRTFHSPLLPDGLMRAADLASAIETEVGDTQCYIYSSPFVRCLQTIAPYARRNSKKVRREYALYERITAAEKDCADNVVNFYPNNFIHDIERTNPLHALLDLSYESRLSQNNITWDETVSHVACRARPFCDDILRTHGHENCAVILVSHMSIVNTILNRDDGAAFPMGGLVRVDLESTEKGGEWSYTPLNFTAA